MIINKTTYENPVIVDGEIEKLQFLRKLIIAEDFEDIRKTIIPKKGEKKSGIYTSIESDVRAYFDLSQTLTNSWVIKDKFSTLRKGQVKELLLNRINSINQTLIHLPENLFEYKTIRIEFEKRLMDVIEIRRKHWEYILFKAVNYSDQYFASIVYSQSAADWNKILRLTNDEVELVQSKDIDKIDLMIEEKRKMNW